MKYLAYIVDALNAIEQKYIKIPAIHKATGLIRERVFCYEFYHQLRKVVPSDSEVVINGEIDKRGYPTFDKENPDFVFHIPGSNAGNAVVCEVKGNVRNSGLKKDLKTLCDFVQTKGYESGVFIVFANSISELRSGFGGVIQPFTAMDCASKIWLVALPESNSCQDPVLLSTF